MKKRKTILPALLLFSGSMLAQSGTVAGGGDATGAGGQAAFTIGETVFTDPSGSGGTSSQGVQQVYDITIGIDDITGVELVVDVFPNPASEQVMLRVEDPMSRQLTYRLLDMTGKIISTELINDDITYVPLGALPDGSYVIDVFQENNIRKSFTIIKQR